MLKQELGFPSGSAVKNLPANAGDGSLIPRLGRCPGGGSILSGKSHGQRSLEGHKKVGPD